MIINHEEKYKYYSSLLEMPYSKVITLLIKKYGEVTDDYYKEKSYKKFLNGKSIVKKRPSYQKNIVKNY